MRVSTSPVSNSCMVPPLSPISNMKAGRVASFFGRIAGVRGAGAMRALFYGEPAPIMMPIGVGLDHPVSFVPKGRWGLHLPSVWVCAMFSLSRRANGLCSSHRRVHSVHHFSWGSSLHISHESGESPAPVPVHKAPDGRDFHRRGFGSSVLLRCPPAWVSVILPKGPWSLYFQP